jgi:hypothetical protein
MACGVVQDRRFEVIRKICLFVAIMLMLPTVYGDSTVSMEMGFGYYLENPSEVEKTTGDIEPLFLFPPVPGGIYGMPTEPVLHTTEANKERRLLIELPRNADEWARPFRAEGLSVSPAGAKVLRLGTFHIDPGNPEVIGGGAFVNVQSNNFMILMYVSQPTTIKGNLVLGKETITHDLDFPKPGWHWIEVSKQGQFRYRLETYRGEQKNIEFAVLVKEGDAI